MAPEVQTTRVPRVSPPKLAPSSIGVVGKAAALSQSFSSFREEMSKPKRKHYVPKAIKVAYKK